jgi:CBS domain-containing protein
MHPFDSILNVKGRDLHVIGPHATVLQAVETMCRERVGALLVMNDSSLVGIFSERDLMTRVVLSRRDPSVTRVGNVMTTRVFCVPVDLPPLEAMELVTNHRVRHLPVVEGSRVVGVVSIGDLVRWSVRDKEHAIEQLQDYVTGRYPG